MTVFVTLMSVLSGTLLALIMYKLRVNAELTGLISILGALAIPPIWYRFFSEKSGPTL